MQQTQRTQDARLLALEKSKNTAYTSIQATSKVTQDTVEDIQKQVNTLVVREKGDEITKWIEWKEHNQDYNSMADLNEALTDPDFLAMTIRKSLGFPSNKIVSEVRSNKKKR